MITNRVVNEYKIIDRNKALVSPLNAIIRDKHGNKLQK